MKPVAAPTAPVKDDAHVAAKQLEAFFLRQVLAEARPQGAGVLDGGFAGDTFKQMLDEQLADSMANAGGLGMADMFAKQLGKVAGETSAPPHAMQMPTATGPSAAPSDPTAPHFILPVNGRPSSGYGARFDPIQHKELTHPGFDLAAPTGTPVAAAAGGTVTHAGPAGTYGNLVTIRHADGFETRYAHLSTVDVHVGDAIGVGQQIGKVGTTGYSTGPHLHFEVRHDGATVDPEPLLPLNRSQARTNR